MDYLAVHLGWRALRVGGYTPCLSVSNPITQAEVRALADKLDELINTLNVWAWPGRASARAQVYPLGRGRSQGSRER